MPKTHEYEIKDYSKDTVLGRVWFEGGKIKSDPRKLMRLVMRKRAVNGLTHADGAEFMEVFPTAFSTGYQSAKKVKSNE